MGDRKSGTIGVILLNLGGPDSIGSVKPFLYNLFSDRDIIKLGPAFMQKPFAWLISRMRAKKTEKSYSLIGGKSPILDITMAQAKALEDALNCSLFTVHCSLLFKVYVGMRYWHPFIEETVEQMHKDDIKKIIALSLYPHYSIATTGSSVKKFKEAVIKSYMGRGSRVKEQLTISSGEKMLTIRCSLFTVHCITSWFNHPMYIDALVDVIKKGLESFPPSLTLPTQRGREGWGDVHVLFSAHGLPMRFIEEGDPYVHQIQGTIDEITKRISIMWDISYQSKSGPVKWLEPSTDDKIKELAKKGVKNLLIVPISFVSDHIETLYEIDILYKGMAEGLGLNLRRTESLNTHPTFIRALEDMVIKNVKDRGWVD